MLEDNSGAIIIKLDHPKGVCVMFVIQKIGGLLAMDCAE